MRPKDGRKGIQKSTGRTIRFPSRLVDTIAQRTDAVEPGLVRHFVQQTEQMTSMAAQKNIVGNKKKAEMDMATYVGNLRLDSLQPPTPPPLIQFVPENLELERTNVPREEPREEPREDIASARPINFIKLNKMRVQVLQIANIHKKLQQEKKMSMKRFKLKEFSEVTSKYMKAYDKLTQFNQRDFVDRRIQNAQRPVNHLVSRKTNVPSRYMEQYKKIQLEAYNKKRAVHLSVVKKFVARKKQKRNTVHPFNIKIVRKPITQTRHAGVSQTKLTGLDSGEKKVSFKKANKKEIEIKSRHRDFMKNRNNKVGISREAQTSEDKLKALKLELRKRICSGAYMNRAWEKRNKESVAKWLKNRCPAKHVGKAKSILKTPGKGKNKTKITKKQGHRLRAKQTGEVMKKTSKLQKIILPRTSKMTNPGLKHDVQKVQSPDEKSKTKLKASRKVLERKKGTVNIGNRKVLKPKTTKVKGLKTSRAPAKRVKLVVKKQLMRRAGRAVVKNKKLNQKKPTGHVSSRVKDLKPRVRRNITSETSSFLKDLSSHAISGVGNSQATGLDKVSNASAVMPPQENKSFLHLAQQSRRISEHSYFGYLQQEMRNIFGSMEPLTPDTTE